MISRQDALKAELEQELEFLLLELLPQLAKISELARGRLAALSTTIDDYEKGGPGDPDFSNQP